MTSDPYSSDFDYNEYCLQQLENWVNDAVTNESLAPQKIYDTIVKCVSEDANYHKKQLERSNTLLSLLHGYSDHKGIEITQDYSYDLTATGEKFPKTTKSDWNDFWESTNPYYNCNIPDYTEL